MKSKLEQQIKMYSMSKTDNSYYLKGKALMQLAQITQEKGHVEQAIDAFTKAIAIKPDGAYLCERAKAYSQIGSTAEALTDFKSAQSANTDHDDILQSYYIQNMLQDIAVLDNIKSTVKKLRKEKKLPKSFLDSYDSLVDVVTGMRLKVAEHDSQIAFIMEELASIKSEMKQGQGQNIDELVGKLKILSDKVYEVEQKVELVMVVNKITYDNELLNHFEILEPAVKAFGISQVLDMSRNLSPALISEAVEQNNGELLLAGCISLNHVDSF